MEVFLNFVGVIIPMITIAGSAVAFVWKSYRDTAAERRAGFFALMDRIDTEGTIAGKIAAVYQLRFYPEHKDFIVRFCESQQANITGGGTKLLADEMNKTLDFFVSPQQT